MEITWYGLSCFRLAERSVATIITDPYDPSETGYSPLKLAADIVTVSHDAPEHNYLDSIKGTPYVITGPGEYEVGGVFITGIQMEGHKSADDTQRASSHTMYAFEFETLTVVHLGDINRIPTQAEIEALGTVNIALVPIDNTRGLNAARAAEVANMLEPNIVIPMHYGAKNSQPDALNKFLKEMGVSEIATQPSLKISSANLPEELKIMVLDYQRG